MSDANNSTRIIAQLGKALSYIQLPEINIPRRIMRENPDSTFVIKTDEKTLSHKDLQSFGPFYISCMTSAHQDQYESRIRPSFTMEKNVIRMVDTCALNCLKPASAATAVVSATTATAEHGQRVLRYDLRNHRASHEEEPDDGESDVSSMKRLFTYESEFIHIESKSSLPRFLQTLKDIKPFGARLEYLKQICPIMGAVIENLFTPKRPNKPRPQMCMIYTHYAHMLDLSPEPGNKLKGVVPSILNAFGMRRYDRSPDALVNEPYMSYLFLHENSSYNKLSVVNSDANWDGSLVRVLLVSPKFSEGISISNLQQIHILAPDYGLFSKTDQAISRGFRSNGHRKVREMVPDFTGVHVFMHICLSNSRPFPVRLYYYLRMMYMDIRIKAFERYCMTHAYDCSFMQRINKRSINENFTRTCQYMLCDYTCEVKKLDVVVDDSAYYPSLYEHYRPFVKSIIGHVTTALHNGTAFSISGQLDFHLKIITQYGLPEKIASAIYFDAVEQMCNRRSLVLSSTGEHVFPVLLDDEVIPFPARFSFLQRDAATCLQHAMKPSVWFVPEIGPKSIGAYAPAQLGVVSAPSESMVVLKPRKPKSERFVFWAISSNCLDMDIRFFDAHRLCLKKCFEDRSYWYLLKSVVRAEGQPTIYSYKEKSFRDLLTMTKVFPSKLHSERKRVFINCSLALCFKYLRRDVLEHQHAMQNPYDQDPPLQPDQSSGDKATLRRDIVAKALEYADRYTDKISSNQGFKSMSFILMIPATDRSVRRHLFYKVFAHFWYSGFQTSNVESKFVEVSKSVVLQFFNSPNLRKPPTPLLHLLYSLLDDFFNKHGDDGLRELPCADTLLESDVGKQHERSMALVKTSQCIVRILHHFNQFFLEKYVEMIDDHLLPNCITSLSNRNQPGKFDWVTNPDLPTTVQFIDEEVQAYVDLRQPKENIFRNLFYDTYLLLRVLPGTIFKVGKDLHDNSTRVREVYNELGAPRSTANTLAALERLATERGLLISTEHSPFSPLEQVDVANDSSAPIKDASQQQIDDEGTENGRGRARGRGRGRGRGSGRGLVTITTAPTVPTVAEVADEPDDLDVDSDDADSDDAEGVEGNAAVDVFTAEELDDFYDDMLRG
jgi:hypothetical protein